jgi:23S rRNA (adenine2030-N6)-methyltransferase
MNYRHAFHAGNHADVLKHVVLLAVCDALTAKPAPVFALDTHAGRGLYALDGNAARRTAESAGGIGQLSAREPIAPALDRYLGAVASCRAVHGERAYPGSPWLLAHALRGQDRIACCELQPKEAAALKRNFGGDPRIAVYPREGYAAMAALLPPRHGSNRFARGLVLVDPAYESQLQELDDALAGLRVGLRRWAQACYLLWYPIKRRRTLQPFYRRATDLPAQSVLRVELLVRPDDSPLRMNGSGLLVLNAPWQLDQALQATLPTLCKALGDDGGSWRLTWLRAPA